MGMNQAQGRNEAARDGIKHVTDPLAGNRNQVTKGESQPTDHEIAPADRIDGEPTIWRAGPSQWTKLGTCALSLVLAVGAVALGIVYLPWLALLLLIPAAVAGWTYLDVRARVYELTTERFRFYSGVFNRNIDEIELYRIKDSTIDKPFQLRIFGLGNVHIVTSDRSRPSVELHGITDAVIESIDGISAMLWRVLTRIAHGPVFGSADSLAAQNRRFHGTGGRSQENRSQGFRPAFLDTLNGTIHLSRFADGRIAPMHLLDGLPRELIRQRSASGRPIAVSRRLITGFERDGRFYTRAQAAVTIDNPVCVP